MRYKKGDFFIVPNRSALSGIDPLGQVVFLWLCARADEEGVCFPSVARLASDTGMSRASVFNKIKVLENRGLIQKTSGNSTESNTYQIVLSDSGLAGGLGVVKEIDGGSTAGGLGVVYEVDPNDTHLTISNNNTCVPNGTPVRIKRKESSKRKEPTPITRAECYDTIQKRRDSRDDMTALIAEYLHRRRFVCDTKEGVEMAFNRHRRPAKLLLAFSVQEVIKAMDEAEKKIPEEWTLETCYKILTK